MILLIELNFDLYFQLIGTQEQITHIINAGIFPKLIEILRTGDFDIQKESAWAISNATSGGSAEQILYLAENGVIPPLCNLLTAPDNRVITVALEGLENILRAGKSSQVFLLFSRMSFD